MAQNAIEGTATVEEVVTRQRADIDVLAADVLKLANACKGTTVESVLPNKPGEDRGEVIANLTLAYRHLEDAKMRLGKVFQARDGGVSNSPR